MSLLIWIDELDVTLKSGEIFGLHFFEITKELFKVKTA